MESQSESLEQSIDLRYSVCAREALNEIDYSFTITDPCLFGHPIVFASRGFLQMVGYSRDEVIGKNGRMFQGPETNRRSVMEIREAIREQRGLQINMLNYRKDGTPFWMLFHMCPVFSEEDGNVVNFVAVQVPILKKSRGGIVRSRASSQENKIRVCKNPFRCCKTEVFLSASSGGSPLESVSSDYDDDDKEFDINEPCEASDVEKIKATTAISNILSVLTHYSAMTGRLVCRKRCCLPWNGQLGSSLNMSLGRIRQSFVLTDALSPDLPIVYASEGFTKLTGYARHEVIGKNCRFLSGEDTDPVTKYQISESLRTQQSCTVRILNYRKDKTAFWNFLHISPVRNASGKVAFFVGIQINDHCTSNETQGLCPEMRHLSVVGAVKVAVRSLSMSSRTSDS